MRSWLKRAGYLVLLLLWLMVMAFPTFAFLLSTNGEIQFGEDPKRHVRFFMVQEEASSGVGVEWVRGASQVDNCTQTSLLYFLWEGSSAGQNTTFCQCYEPATDVPLSVEESSCTQ